jgi:hypothetical protein
MAFCPKLESAACTGGCGRAPAKLGPMPVDERSEPTLEVGGSVSEVLRRPQPGPLFRVVKIASWVELGLFAILLVVWLAPGLEHETFYAGLAHGIGFIALALLIWIAVLRHEAPYTLLAATLTPVGPVGSVIAIAWIERRPG